MSLEEFRELFGVFEFCFVDEDGKEHRVSIMLMDVFLGIAGAVVVRAMI
jgi:hypothetical protein